MTKKQLKVWLENLQIEVPVHELIEREEKVVVRLSDIPKKIAQRAKLIGKYITYRYGENGGGNRIIGGETEEEKKAQEFINATAQAIIDLATGVNKILNGRLKKNTIILLVQEAAGGRNTISKELVEKILYEPHR